MEATCYVEINEYGSAVVTGTQIHVDAIGYAHEGGQSEQSLSESRSTPKRNRPKNRASYRQWHRSNQHIRAPSQKQIKVVNILRHKIP